MTTSALGVSFPGPLTLVLQRSRRWVIAWALAASACTSAEPDEAADLCARAAARAAELQVEELERDPALADDPALREAVVRQRRTLMTEVIVPRCRETPAYGRCFVAATDRDAASHCE